MPVFYFYKEIFQIFSVLHEFSHLAFDHPDNVNEELSADYRALSLLSRLRVPNEMIHSSLLLLIAAMYFKYHIFNFNMDGYPSYLERLLNLIQYFNKEDIFDSDGVFLSQIIKEIDIKSFLKTDFDYFSSENLSYSRNTIVDNYNKLSKLVDRDEGILKVCEKFDNIINNVSASVCTVTVGS